MTGCEQAPNRKASSCLSTGDAPLSVAEFLTAISAFRSKADNKTLLLPVKHVLILIFTPMVSFFRAWLAFSVPSKFPSSFVIFQLFQFLPPFDLCFGNCTLTTSTHKPFLSIDIPLELRVAKITRGQNAMTADPGPGN